MDTTFCLLGKHKQWHNTDSCQVRKSETGRIRLEKSMFRHRIRSIVSGLEIEGGFPKAGSCWGLLSDENWGRKPNHLSYYQGPIWHWALERKCWTRQFFCKAFKVQFEPGANWKHWWGKDLSKQVKHHRKTSSNIDVWFVWTLCFTMFYKVWFLSNILSNIVKHFFCSWVWRRIFWFIWTAKHCWIHAHALGFSSPFAWWVYVSRWWTVNKAANFPNPAVLRKKTISL